MDARPLDDVFIGLFAEKLDVAKDGDDLDEVITDLSRFGLPALGEFTAHGWHEKRDYVIDLAWEWLSQTLSQARMFEALMTRMEQEAFSKEQSA